MSDSQKEEEKTTADADPKAESPESPEEANAAADPADADAASPAHDGDDQTDEDEDEDEDEDAGVEANQSSNGKGGSSSSTALLIGALCLAAGFGIGWFGHDFQIKKEIKTADAAVQGEGEGARGPCKDWETALCTSLGEKAHACVQAKSAGALLSGSACSQATKSVAATIDKIKAERASCTNMETKLCAELGADSKSCELVKAQTPSFPPDRCDKMMENYDQVLSQLKMMEQRGGLPGGPPPGHPGGPGPRGPGGPGGPGTGGPGGPPVSVTPPPAPAPAP